MSGILRLESLTKGNTLKQGDKTPLKYRLFDADGEKLNVAGKSAKVRLVYPDFLTIGYEKDGLVVAQDDTVTFTIDGVIPSRIYHVEIIVDDQFIFPSRADEAKFTVDKSSLGTESNIIEIVGVDAVVRKAVDLINTDPSLIIDEDKLVSDIITNTGIGSINDYYKAFNDLKPKAEQAITKSDEALTRSQNALGVANGIDAKATNALSLSESADTLSKSVQEQFNQVVIDGDSSIEAAQARVDASGQTNPTLKARLDKEHNEVTAQLAHATRNYSEPQATFVIVDDDARDTVWTYLKPLLDSRGIKGTISVPASYIDTPNFLTSNQVVELSKQGWDIVNHANTNIRLGEQTPSKIRQEFNDSQNFLKSLGIDTRTLVYPMGSYSQSVVDIATEYFDAALIDQGSENYGKLNTFAIKRLGIGTVGTTNLNNIKGSVDRTIANGGLCILMTHVQHHVADAPIIEETIDYILSKGGVFKTFKEAFEEHKNIMEIGRYDTSKNYSNFTLSKNGEVYFDGDRGYYTNVNTTLPSSAPPSAYKLGVTINNYQDSASSDLPRGLGGTVITIKALNSNNRYNIQYYFKYETGEMHTRMGVSGGAWGDWKSDVKLINTQIRPFTAPASEYPLGVTLAYYSTADSSGTPSGVGGTLTTYIAHLTNHNYNYQEFKEFGNNRKHVRSAITDGSWKSWNKLSDAP